MKKVSGKSLVQQDLQEVIRRLNSRMEEALRIFSQKRSREHFKDLFFNRYKIFSVSVLSDLNADTYSMIVSIYEEIDSLYWYLMSTEDMPSQVETNVLLYIKKMNSNYAEIADYFINDISLENDREIEDDTANDLSDEYQVSGEPEVPPPFQEDSNEES